MARTRSAAFSEEEKESLTKKPSKVAKPDITEHGENTENTSGASAAQKPRAAKPDGIHAVRGMSLQINEMLAMGCYTPDEIIRCILPNTRDCSERQAVTKLQSHLKNMIKHGAVIRRLDGDCICCADVVLPELPD